jgi:hypothetical protein
MYMALMKMRSKKQKAKMRKTKRYKGGMNGMTSMLTTEPSKNSTNAQPSTNGQVVPAPVVTKEKVIELVKDVHVKLEDENDKKKLEEALVLLNQM